MRFGKNILTYAIGDLAGKAVALVTSPFITRLLTPQEFGSFGLLSAVWSLVALLQFGGMETAYQVFRAKNRDAQKEQEMFTTATRVATLSFFIVWGIFSLGAFWGGWLEHYAKVNRTQLLWYLLGLVPTILLSWYLYLFRFRHQPFPFVRTNFLSKVASAFILLILLFFTPPQNRFTMFLAGTFFLQGLTWVWALRELKRYDTWPYSYSFFSKPLALNMFKFGISFIPGAATYAAVVSMDRLMVGWLIGPVETAIVQLALSLGSVALMLKMWFSLVWDPSLVEWLATRNPEIYLPKLQLVLISLSITFFPLACLTAVWSDVIVAILYPTSYMPAARLLSLIMLTGACSTLSLVGIATNTLDPSPKFYFMVYCCALFLTFIIGFALIPLWGALGAILGTLGAEIFILGCWVLRGHYLKKNLHLNWSPVLILGAISGVWIALYRPGVILSGQIFMERLFLTLLICTFVAFYGQRIVHQAIPDWRYRIHHLWMR
jgi:O-antigen/teichoic acid export membrane protein